MSTDGGYYAIKGFLFQFDKTIIDILTNPSKQIHFEQIQDINTEEYVIQVKHKETQAFQNHKIRDPIIQLINEFANDQSRRYCLYCYFSDMPPQKWYLNIDELNKILGSKANSFDLLLKKRFVESFWVQFSEDYLTQFESALQLIRVGFDTTLENAILYHSIIRSKLLELSTGAIDKRSITKAELEDLINTAEKQIFYSAYASLLSKEDYEKLVRKQYFTVGKNLENFERLFIIEYDGKSKITSLISLIKSISEKFFSLGKSPAPYVCFRKMEEQTLTTLKQDIIDCGIKFTDGTCFHGDRFRINQLIEPATRENEVEVKFVSEKYLSQVMTNTRIRQTFQFFIQDTLQIIDADNHYDHVQIEIQETNQVIRIIRGNR